LQPKEVRKFSLGEDTQLHIGEEEDQQITTVVEYYFRLRILANTSSQVGLYKVASKIKVQPTQQIEFAPLEVNLNYTEAALRCAIKQPGGQARQLRWLEAIDLETRGAMVSMMRQGWAQGEALSHAWAERMVQWTTVLEPVRDRTPPRDRRDHVNEQPSTKKRQRDAERVSGDKPLTGTHTARGWKICKRYNDARSCTKREDQCPHKGAHVCDMLTGSDKVCGSNSHTRQNCPHKRKA
jgi:hypothetical protein